MIIHFIPVRMGDAIEYAVMGDSLIVNGERFDFSRMKNGDVLAATAIASDCFGHVVTRTDGQIELSLILPNPHNYSHEQAFPVSLFNVTDGPVPQPPPLPEEEPMPVPELSPEDMEVLEVTDE